MRLRSRAPVSGSTSLRSVTGTFSVPRSGSGTRSLGLSNATSNDRRPLGRMTPSDASPTPSGREAVLPSGSRAPPKIARKSGAARSSNTAQNSAPVNRLTCVERPGENAMSSTSGGDGLGSASARRTTEPSEKRPPRSTRSPASMRPPGTIGRTCRRPPTMTPATQIRGDAIRVRWLTTMSTWRAAR